MDFDAIRAARALADAALRWRDADFPPRVRATRGICDRTGYTEPVVDFALDALFGAIDGATILATIASELGDVAALDGFVARPGRPDVAYAPRGRAAIVSSDTTIGVALAPLVFALCAGCTVEVKDRDDRLVGAFLETLAQEAPELSARATATPWRGDDDGAARERLGRADVALVFGSDAALARIRALVPPHARFVGFGHRTSIGYVARAALGDETSAFAVARAAARDVLLYDGEGCLSPHAIFVERDAGVSPETFAGLLARACDEAAVEFPAGYAELDATIVAYARAARFRASQGAGSVHAGALAPHLVTYEASHEIAPPLLRRTVATYGIAGPSDALAFLHRHRLPLEGLAFATPPARDDLLAFARASGAARVALLGDLQRPPLGGDHGGEGRILPFVRAIYRG